jgi:adenosylcobinamide-phosphate synthase
MNVELALLAYLFDNLFGELPCKHPVMLMGDFITAFEKRFYKDRLLPGLLLVVSLVTATLLLSVALVYLCQLLPPPLSLVALALLASSGLAMQLLHRSVAEILTAEHPRLALSYLVSRDTTNMTETELYKAAIETWAENLSDGVIAPLFYLLLFGLPGIAVYKAINTLDSMVGYKTPRYFYFGKTAARLDDVANFIPARLTALLIVALAPNKRRAWQCLLSDGNQLESPNAGYPIAAMAGALGVALGGDAWYHGQLKHKPTLGLAINTVNQLSLSQALAMKDSLNALIIGFLIAGALLA